MPKTPMAEEKITIPSEVEVNVEDARVKIKGPKGKLERDFLDPTVKITKENDTITVQADFPRKKEKAKVGTFTSHIRNMIKGVTDGFEYRLKIVYSHFPLTVEPKGREILIKNYLGERSPRVAKIVGKETNVRVEGDNVIVEGINKEEVAQTAANIQQITRLRGKLRKDFRTFMDGVYIYSKQ